MKSVKFFKLAKVVTPAAQSAEDQTAVVSHASTVPATERDAATPVVARVEQLTASTFARGVEEKRVARVETLTLESADGSQHPVVAVCSRDEHGFLRPPATPQQQQAPPQQQ